MREKCDETTEKKGKTKQSEQIVEPFLLLFFLLMENYFSVVVATTLSHRNCISAEKQIIMTKW
jgi:hypothetical protein